MNAGFFSFGFLTCLSLDFIDNMINTDWLFSAIIGKTYSPVSVGGHDVQIPSALEGRDENSFAIDALGFRSLLMRQLRKLATMWIGSGMILEDQALFFENDLDRLDMDMPDWCAIDVENFERAYNYFLLILLCFFTRKVSS